MNDSDLFKENVEMYGTAGSVKHYENLKDLKGTEKFLIEKYFYGKVLDLGCGVGRTTKHIFDLGFDVLGVDIVGEMIERAKKIYPKIKFEQGDACELKYKDNSFDIVFFSFNGLDYIYPESKRVTALREIERVLKKDGYFIYSSHNPWHLLFKFRPNFILRNIKEGKLFSKYKSEKNNFATFYTYFATPKKQKKLAELNTNLKFVEQVPKSIKELHPHYVFRKL